MARGGAPHAGELFTSPSADLYVIDNGESTLMQSGRFALMLVKNPASQLAAVVAMVGELQWPVGRDCCVVRNEEGGFTFSLPGPLTYDLVVASPSADLQKLEHILEEYSDCQKPAAESHTQQNIDSITRMQPLQSSPASDSRKRAATDSPNPQLKRRLLRARRISAVAKVFTKSLERGAINVASHVEPMNTVAPRQQILSNCPALASVDAVTKVVDAVETGGRTLLESAGSGASGVGSEDNRQSDANTTSNATLSNLAGWTLNQLGLLMIFRVITTSMARHGSGSSSRSGSSSSSDQFQRLLSSSSSSSSFSSKSPTTPSHVQGGGTTDVTNSALSLQSPATAGVAMPSPVPGPPPPPLFSHHTPRSQHLHMPPPSSPLPPMASGSPSQTGIAFSGPVAPPPIRIYKPRPTPAAPATSAPPPPAFLPRPPRFQPPPKS